jgi:hypothetical protein
MEIIWSPQSKKDYWQNIDYLEAEWTFQDVINFINQGRLHFANAT